MQTIQDVGLDLAASAEREKPSLLARKLFAVVLLFAAALAIRLYHLDDPPLNFHATRQYRSLTIARGYYYASQPDIPEWQKQVASINMQRQGILEPPVMEILASVGYRIFGGEHYWIPKSLSIFFWLIGAIFLYKISDRISGETPALFSIAFYLFLPFSIVASRSFQPDPLMITFLLASLYAMVRYYDQPSKLRLTILSMLSAVAIFVKPVSLFVIYVTLTSLSMQRLGVKRSVTSPVLILFFAVAFLPALLFYLVYGMFLSGDLQVQAQASFVPGLLFDPFFWKGWLDNLNKIIGYPALAVAFLGALMVPKGLPRALIFGLWSGYALFCLVFGYHIASHDYYHLQLIPIVALSLGSLFASVLERLRNVGQDRFMHPAIWGILLAGVIISAISVRGRLADPAAGGMVSLAEEVGEVVDHSTKNVYLASDYGLSLQYHGELSGQPWPLASDLEWEQLTGLPVIDAEARFNKLFAKDAPDYFIVMDLREFEQQEDLEAFLTQNYSIAIQNDLFLIYDLRTK